MRDRFFIFWLILLIALPVAEARQDDWGQVGGAMDVTHEFPDKPIPDGSVFVITGTAWGVTSAVDAVTWGDLVLIGDCILVDDAVGGTDELAFFNATIQQSGPVCSWHRTVTATAVQFGGVTEVLGHVIVSGNSHAFSMTEFGTTPDKAATGFWLPFLFFIAAWLWGGYSRQPWVLVPAIIGIVAHFIGMDTVVLVSMLIVLLGSVATLRHYWTDKQKEA